MLAKQTRAACGRLLIGAIAMVVSLGTAYGESDAKSLPSDTNRSTDAAAIGRLVAACEEAKATFVAPGQSQVERAKSSLDKALRDLDARLKAAPLQEAGWREYLMWAAVREELAREEGPDLERLNTAHTRYARGHRGLNLVWFAKVRGELRRYLVAARLVGNAKLKGQYESVLDTLAARLEDYAKEPLSEKQLAIDAVVKWLEEAAQAEVLVGKVRRHFSRPNLFFAVSEGMVQAGLERPIDRVDPVCELILGTTIRGTGHLRGHVGIDLVRSDTHARIDTVLRGAVATRTIGSNGPARISSIGTTRVTARKSLLVDSEQIRSRSADTDAVVNTTITGLCLTRGGRLLERLVMRRADAQKGEAECIAAGRAERRLNRQVDREAEDAIGEANVAFRKKLRKPLADRDLFPDRLSLHTTADQLRGMALFGGDHGLAAPGGPPRVEGEADLVVQLHESMVNNILSGSLGGMIVDEEVLRSQLTEVLGRLPEKLKPAEEEEPWTITFPRHLPVTVGFDRGRVSLAIRGRSYTREGNTYPGMNVEVAYLLSKRDDRFLAVRDDAPEVFPPGFVKEKGRRLSAREQVLRRLLERRFGKLFEEELSPENLVPREPWDKIGELKLTHWEASNGWLVLAWKR